VSELIERLRRLVEHDDLLTRLRRIIEHDERLPGWEDETGSDERLSLYAHVRARLAEIDERGDT
jgi:hypothetical protein